MVNVSHNWVKAFLVSGVKYPIVSALAATVEFTEISDLFKIAFLDLDNFGWLDFLGLAEIR